MLSNKLTLPLGLRSLKALLGSIGRNKDVTDNDIEPLATLRHCLESSEAEGENGAEEVFIHGLVGAWNSAAKVNLATHLTRGLILTLNLVQRYSSFVHNTGSISFATEDDISISGA
jgi:hypothetical protein